MLCNTNSILKQNMYQSSILKQNMIVTQIIPKFCKCITNDTSVFYFYHKWYLFTQNYLLTFSIRVLQHVVEQRSILKQNLYQMYLGFVNV
jgi:TRAP-type mannitol/chloroaromatic compound transport system permease small subunit